MIVDEDQTVEAWVSEQLGSNVVFTSNLTEGIKSLGNSRGDCVAIIATLGSSHLTIVDRLLDEGVRLVYIEKPLATSLGDCRSIVDHAESVGGRVTVGLQRRFNGLANEIRRTGETLLGGPPVAMNVHGGAQCMITNGTHWLDLACDVFSALPLKVSALLSAQQINPRGVNLEMWQGGATWSFTEGRTLTMSYNNRSSADGQVQIYFPLGRIDLNSDGTTMVLGRNMDEVARDSRVTRVGDLVPIGPMDTSGLLSDPVGRAVMELAGSSELTYSLRTAANVAEAALGALLASHEGRTLDLPVPETHPLFDYRWAVT